MTKKHTVTRNYRMQMDCGKVFNCNNKNYNMLLRLHKKACKTCIDGKMNITRTKNTVSFKFK